MTMLFIANTFWEVALILITLTISSTFKISLSRASLALISRLDNSETVDNDHWSMLLAGWKRRRPKGRQKYREYHIRGTPRTSQCLAENSTLNSGYFCDTIWRFNILKRTSILFACMKLEVAINKLLIFRKTLSMINNYIIE